MAVMDILIRAQDQASKALENIGALAADLGYAFSHAGEKMQAVGESMSSTFEQVGEQMGAVEAVGEALPETFGEVGDKMEAAGAAGDILSDSVGTAGEKMGEAATSSAGLAESLKSTGETVGKVGEGLSKGLTAPILAAAGSALALAVNIGSVADRISDLSAITGMSTAAIQEWQYASRIAGVAQETVTNAVAGLVRRLPMLEAEGGRVTEQLGKLGVSFAELQAMAPDKMIETLISRMAEMQDPLERNAVGASLFGGAWKEIAPLLDMGAEGIAATRREAHELGLVLGDDVLEEADKFRMEMERLKSQIGAVFLEIASKLAPMLKDVLAPIIRERIIPALDELAENVERLIKWFGDLSPAWQNTILVAGALLAALGPVIVILGKIISAAAAVAGFFKGLAAAAAAANIPLAKFIALKALLVIKVLAVIAVIALLVAAIVWLSQNWHEAIAAIGRAWDWLKAKTMEIVAAMVEFFRALPGRLWEILTIIIARVVEWRAVMIARAKEAAQGVWDAIVNTLRELPGRMLSFGRELIDNLTRGIRGAIGKVGEAVDNVRAALNRINPFARSSPSLVDQVRAGVAAIRDEYAKLGGIGGMQLPALAPVGAGLQPAGAGVAGAVTYAPVVNIYSPEPLDAAQIRRQQEKTLRAMAVEWGLRR